MSVLKNAIKKKIKVSINDPIKEDVSGATNQVFFLSLSKIWTSINCAIKKAVQDPIAILIEIRSEKFVEKKSVISTPKINTTYTTFLAVSFPKLLLDRSVIKKVIG